jgi:hypothetical protein
MEFAAIALETLHPQTNNFKDDNIKHNDEALYLFVESYPLSQIICKTNNNNDCSFVGLLQHVKEWQKAVFENFEHYHPTVGKEYSQKLP